MKYIICTFIVLLSFSAIADPTKEERQMLAKELLDKGFAAYEAGDYSSSAQYYTESIQQWGTVLAAANLCNLYLYGQGVPQDYSKAYALCSMAAEHNNLNALVMLGEMHMNGRGVQANEDLAITFYRRAAEGGHIHGQYVLGMLLFEKSPSEAKTYIKKAASNGHLQAKEYLASLQ